MRKSRFSEEQIIGVLREQETGGTTAEVCRRHGVSEQTFYRWKAKYGGMAPSDAVRLKTLEDENRRLKKLLAEAMLDVAALKDVLGKTDPARRSAGGRAAPDGGAGLLASGGPVPWRWSIRRRCAASRSRTTRRSGRGCASSQESGAASATGASASCWNGKALP